MTKNGSNAILAKARAMYGKRITRSQYDEMLRCKSVSEVAGYLKSHTHYGTSLAGIAESSVHRGQLEDLLRRTAFDDYNKLYRYQIGDHKDLFHYFVVEEEIVEILRMVLLLKADNAKSFILDLPGHLISRTHINLMEIAKVTSYKELVQVLGDGEYSAILKRFQPVSDDTTLDYVGIEHAFYTHLYNRLYAMIDRNYRGSEAQEFRALLSAKLELLNITHIYRAVSYLNMPKEDLVKSLYLHYDKLTHRQLDELCDAKNQKEFLDAFHKTYYQRRYPLEQIDYFEHYADSIFYQLCRHALHFTASSEIAFYTFLSLRGTEQSNIINIIEGIRYQVPENDIKQLLIL